MPELKDLIRLSEKHVKTASLVLSRAFQNDPIIRWLISDVNKRLVEAHRIFEIKLRIGIRYGEVYGTSKNLEGVAIWRPPKNVNFPYWKYLTKGGFKLPFKFGRKFAKIPIVTGCFLTRVPFGPTMRCRNRKEKSMI